MPIMLSKTYDALRSAQGVTEEQARTAAEEIAGFESRFAALESDLKVLKWMAGASLGLHVAVLAFLLRLLSGVR